MDKIWFVARRDLLYHIRKKDFYWSTLGVPLLIGAIYLFAQLFGGDPSGQTTANLFIPDNDRDHSIGIVDQAGVIKQHFEVISPTTVLQFDDQVTAESALRQAQIESLFLIPADYQQSGTVTRTTRTASIFDQADTNAVRTLLAVNQLRSPHIDFVPLLFEPISLSKAEAIGKNVRVAGNLNQNFAGSMVPIGFAMAIYISIFMGASLLMQGILEEKENRTLEVLLTSISPRELLTGKMVGLGIVAFIQLGFWAILAVGVLRGQAIRAALNQVQIEPLTWLLLGIFFLLGYLFYASLTAGIGAISPSMRELSQLIILVSVPAMIPLMFITSLLSKPNGSLALILSIIPFTAPSTMMLRSVMTVVPPWQIGLSIGLLALSVVATLSLTARLFRATILLRGSKFSFRGLWQALR
ncbi:ABC transporter permease [Herpetosiphon llansteffanensis]